MKLTRPLRLHRAGSSAICAGTLVSLSPRDALHAILQLRTASAALAVHIAVVSRAEYLSAKIDTSVPAQMADEPARCSLSGLVSFTQLKKYCL